LPQHIGDYANGVAQSWHNLASVHQSAGRNDEALQNYLEAVRIRTELHTREPKYAEYAMSLASSLWSAGRMSQALKRSAEAADYYRKAVAVMENLNQQNPNVKAYQDRLSAIQRSLDQLASGSSTPNGK
jgi:tetratricopeptide (TPR) repeat protein